MLMLRFALKPFHFGMKLRQRNTYRTRLRGLSMSEYEARYFDGLSIREEGQATVISGVAVPFFDGTPGTEYELAEGYFERFSADTDLQPLFGEVEACIMHERQRIIGLTPNTLKLRKTNRGLECDILLDDSTDSRDAKIMVANRKLKGMSIQFHPTDIKQSKDGDKNIVNIKAAKISHVALVSQPAYKSTETYLRSLNTNKEKELLDLCEKKVKELIDSL